MRIDLSAFKKPCACGKEHPLAVRDIRIEAGALASLPGLLAENGWKTPCIVCDENTWAAAGSAASALLPDAGAARLSPQGLHADEHGVEAARALLPARADVLLAVGSGTVHDITRYLANERGVPFVSVPTAASVDGFVSTVAAMTWQGCKKTIPAVAPLYVVADSDVVAAAPGRLNASGFGDLLGKHTALADWEIARLVTDEYHCPTVAALMRRAVGEACEQLDAIAAGGREGCEKLLYGLLLSGLAMQMVGNSRPASGAEHHISHLWEMEVLNGPLDALHGEKVGVGLALCAGAYHAFARALGGGALRPAARPDAEEDIRRVFTNPGTASLVLEENRPDPLDGVTAQQVLARRGGILAAIGAIPEPDALRALLRRAGAPASVGELGLPEEIVPDTLRYSPYVRARLTLMRLRKLFA